MSRILVCAALVSGCVVPDEPDISTYTSAAACKPSVCGFPNSPVVGGVEFWEIYPIGIANTAGVVVQSVQRAGTPVRLRVIDDRLRAETFASPPTIYAGPSLKGTEIDLLVGEKPFRVTIDRVSPTLPAEEEFWVGDHRRVEAYDFLYVPLRGDGTPDHVPPAPLCTPKVEDPGGSTIRAVVFGGDVYDPVTKNISFSTSSQRFNIACRDSALYKMHMIGHTTAAKASLTGSVPSVPATSLIKRKAMLDAWTANFCGDGHSFTSAGTKILVSESQGMLPDDSPALDDGDTPEEAIWGGSGALCLDTPRIGDADAIKEECAKRGKILGPCDAVSLPAVYVRTAIP